MRAYTLPASPPAPVPPAAFWNEQVRDNTDALYQSIRRIGHVTRGASGADNYTVSATTVGAAADVFSSDITWTADGTSSYLIEAFFPAVVIGATATSGVNILLVDGSGTEIARLSEQYQANGEMVNPVNVRFYYTPAAGSRSINIRATRQTSNGTIRMGGGAAPGYAPGLLSVFGPAIP
jgi:hypothetical protein